MGLLVHVVAECFSQGVCSYAVDPKSLPGIRQNVIGLLPAYGFIGKMGGFKQIFEIPLSTYIFLNDWLQLGIYGETFFLARLFLPYIYSILVLYVPDPEF